jgi:putative hemolysin
LEIVIAAVCVLVSALFSGTEVALFALRRVDREQMARSQRGADKRVLALLQQPRLLITTVLLAKESVNAVLTVMVLQVIARELASPWVVGLVTIAAMIPVVVLAGEVTPKTLALKAPLAWARTTAGPLALFTALVMPVRWLIGGFVEIVLRSFGAAPRPGNRDLSEEEFRILIDASSAQGQVDARERRLIHKVFEFSDKNVGQIMTPRDRVFALSYDLPTARLLKEVAARGFSRVPIYQKSLDNVRGILNAKDLLRPAVGQVARTLGELLHEPLFVPRTTPIKRVFLTFKQRKVHMAIVVNEYGKVLGLVTMDDVLAQLFGTLRDEREGLQAAGRRGRPPAGRTPAAGVPMLEETGGDERGSGGDGAPDVEVVAVLAPAEAPSVFLAAPLNDSMRPRRSSRIEVHEEDTPPAVDPSELTPAGMPEIRMQDHSAIRDGQSDGQSDGHVVNGGFAGTSAIAVRPSASDPVPLAPAQHRKLGEVSHLAPKPSEPSEPSAEDDS